MNIIWTLKWLPNYFSLHGHKKPVLILNHRFECVDYWCILILKYSLNPYIRNLEKCKPFNSKI